MNKSLNSQTFVFGSENTKLLKRTLNGPDDLDCVVAFWGSEIISTLRSNLKRNPKRKLRIICNLQSGAVNPEFAEFCLNSKQIQIKTDPRLHSKVIFSKNEYVVGSANISSNGLGHEGEELKGWMESSITGKDSVILQSVANWFVSEWGKADKINTEMLKEAKINWQKRKHNPTVMTVKRHGDLLQAILKDPHAFNDKNIYLAIYRSRHSPEGQKKHEKVEQDAGIKDLASYENWSLPENSFFIDIYYGIRGAIEINDMNYIHANPLVAKIKYDDGHTGSLVFGKCVGSIGGYKKLCKNTTSFKKIVPKLFSAGKGDDDGRIVDISQILEVFSKVHI